MDTFGRLDATVCRQVNRAWQRWQLPTPLALLNLRAFRDELRQFNVDDLTSRRQIAFARHGAELPKYRTDDGL